MENNEVKNVICIKWGTKYTVKYINALYHGVINNTKYKINFYCFTDNSDGLDSGIIVKPLPKLNVKEIRNAYLKEVGLCANDLVEELVGQRVLYFDLDTVIVGNIDSFFEIPKNDEFYIIKDWNHSNGKVGQGSCFSFVVGTLGYIKDYFEEHYEEIYKKYYTASQEYLSDKVVEKYNKLNFWPDEKVKSFRFHCLPTPLIPFLRHFKTATIPANASVICFHGRPKLEEAIEGIWPEKHLWKKIFYKHLKPVDWLKEYWK